MAKYKLIKIYPKSPPLGTIVEVGNDGYLTYRMRSDYNREMTSIHESVLTEYSEFWEEVVEKEYEILSYIQIISNRIYKKDKEGVFVSDNGWNLSAPVEAHSNISIHSVKRLSDGEV